MSRPLRVSRPKILPLMPRMCQFTRHHGETVLADVMLVDPYGGRYQCCAACAAQGLTEWTEQFERYVASGDWITSEATR